VTSPVLGGGSQAMGGAIGDVYLSSAFKNHDRRIPIPGFDVFGTGTVTAPECPNLVKALGLKVLLYPATLSTCTQTRELPRRSFIPAHVSPAVSGVGG
jgi:hypothetical protein